MVPLRWKNLQISLGQVLVLSESRQAVGWKKEQLVFAHPFSWPRKLCGKIIFSHKFKSNVISTLFISIVPLHPATECFYATRKRKKNCSKLQMLNSNKKKILRWPRIELGSIAWKAALLTIIPPTLHVKDVYKNILSTNC